ncbi:hypothetical protein [Leifsonia sp. NPDC058248]|uniref:hypothetical protein n=1 Tax=Leifsonia sp. NPDC058248 TaxID=3346402 RepID=UPI0036D78B74
MTSSELSGVCSPDANPADETAVAGIRELLATAVTRLETAGARDEALATFIPRHRRMLVTREAVLQPAGRVWRLGVLLLDREGALRATGSITRATEPGRPAYQSRSAETRRAYRAAAQRGHFAPGETVNYDAEPIELTVASLRAARGPLFVRNGRALVRWSPTTADANAVDFRGYLTERVGLLTDPPEGA